MRYYFKSKLGNTRHVLADGSLLCLDVPIARTGEQEYGASELPGLEAKNGMIIVDRRPDEVFRPETIASFEGMSTTYHHPNEAVTPENWKKYTVGHAQNVRRGETENSNYILADLVFKDQEAINAINNGVNEISCGYDAEYVQDEPGRAYQKNIIGNHVALVPDARGGSVLSIQDSKFKGVKPVSKPTSLKGLVRSVRHALFSKDEAAAQEALNAVEDQVAELEKDSEEKKEGTFDAESEIKGVKDSIEELKKSVDSLLAGQKTGDSEQNTEDEDNTEDSESGLTGDSAQDIVSKAELIMPGIEIPKKVTHDFKRVVLTTAKATADGKTLLSTAGVAAVDFQKADKLTVDMAFNVASTIAQTRNSQVNISVQPKGGNSTILRSADEINKFNQEFYKRG